MHTSSKERMALVRLTMYQSLESVIAIRFIFSFVTPVVQRYKQKTVQEVPQFSYYAK